MSAADHTGPEPDGDDFVAAEYVLGVLPVSERAATSQRIEVDGAFARLVDGWEVRFAPLGFAYPEVEPPAPVKASLDRLLFSGRAAPASASGGVWASLAVWRGLAAAALVLLAAMVAAPYFTAPVTPQQRMLASLAADGSDVRFVALYDAGRGEVAMSHLAGVRAAEHDFELWMIEGKNAPVSMGVIPAGSSVTLAVPPAAQAKLSAGAVLAISVEPVGGSPTGQPTGAVVAAGDLRSI